MSSTRRAAPASSAAPTPGTPIPTAYTYDYHPAGPLTATTQEHDGAFRPVAEYQDITLGGVTTTKQISKSIYNDFDQLRQLRLSVQGDMSLQDIDYRYDVMGRLTHINQIDEDAGYPLVSCATTVATCIDCAVASSAIAIDQASIAAAPALAVTDLRLGGGESVALAYPYPVAELDRLWDDLDAVTDADPSTAGALTKTADGIRFASGVPLDYLELVDQEAPPHPRYRERRGSQVLDRADGAGVRERVHPPRRPADRARRRRQHRAP